MRPTRQAPPSSTDLRSEQGDGSPTILSRVGDAPPAVTSLLLLLLLLLLAGDVENNPGPSSYACYQNVSLTHTSPATRQIAELESISKPDVMVCPALNSLYRGIAQPTAGPGHQLPLKPLTPATAVTTRSGQAQGLSHVLPRAA